MKSIYYYESPIGKIGIAENGEAITNVYFQDEEVKDAIVKETPLILKAATELNEYFKGLRKSFDVPLMPSGTDFRNQVWQSLCEIPYGETRSYKDVAININNPKAFRAVGLANHNNPIPIFIPCHRVIGKDHKLVGYAGGLEIKKYLLELEGYKDYK